MGRRLLHLFIGFFTQVLGFGSNFFCGENKKKTKTLHHSDNDFHIHTLYLKCVTSGRDRGGTTKHQRPPGLIQHCNVPAAGSSTLPEPTAHALGPLQEPDLHLPSTATYRVCQTPRGSHSAPAPKETALSERPTCQGHHARAPTCRSGLHPA